MKTNILGIILILGSLFMLVLMGGLVATSGVTEYRLGMVVFSIIALFYLTKGSAILFGKASKDQADD